MYYLFGVANIKAGIILFFIPRARGTITHGRR